MKKEGKMINIKLIQRRLLALIESPFAIGYGHCGRCKRKWKFVHGHVTDYQIGSGCFPLCENCWEELSPEQRVPYYIKLVELWMKYDDDIHYGMTGRMTREELLIHMESAVMDGK